MKKLSVFFSVSLLIGSLVFVQYVRTSNDEFSSTLATSQSPTFDDSLAVSLPYHEELITLPLNATSQLSMLLQEYHDMTTSIEEVEHFISLSAEQLHSLQTHLMPVVTDLSQELLTKLSQDKLMIDQLVVTSASQQLQNQCSDVLQKTILLIKGFLANPIDATLPTFANEIKQEIAFIFDEPNHLNYIQMIYKCLPYGSDGLKIGHTLLTLDQTLDNFLKTYLLTESKNGQQFKRHHQQFTATELAYSQYQQTLDELKQKQADVTTLLNEITP